MTTLAIPKPFSDFPALEDAFAFFLALGRAARAEFSPNPSEPDATTIIRANAMVLGRSIAQARDVEEIEARVDEALEDPRFLALVSLSWEGVEDLSTADGIELDDDARAFAMIFKGTEPELVQGFRLLAELVRALRNVIGPEEADEARALARRMGQGHIRVTDLIADPTIPPIIASHILSMFRAMAASLAIFEILYGGSGSMRRSLRLAGLSLREHGMLKPLATRWVIWLRHYLRLVASAFPGAVPEAVIPPDMRLDLAAIDAEHLKVRERFDRLPRQSDIPVEDLPELDEDE